MLANGGKHHPKYKSDMNAPNFAMCTPVKRALEVHAMRCNRVLWGVWQVDRTGPVDHVGGADEGATSRGA